MTYSRRRSVVNLAVRLCSLVLILGMGRAPAKGPVKVLVLAGQSNMEGKALASTLEPVIADPRTHDQFKHLKTDGEWSVREDVWVTFLDRQVQGDGGDIPL